MLTDMLGLFELDIDLMLVSTRAYMYPIFPYICCSGFDLSIQIVLCHYCRSMLIDPFYESNLLLNSYIGALREKIV